MTTLKSELEELRAGFVQRAEPARIELMQRATATLRATGIATTALQIGAVAPALTLPDAKGRAVSLPALWARGPVILVFYRGGWCPYCNATLRAWQSRMADVAAQGATLVAVSPQTSAASLATVENNALTFVVLSDTALAAARGFGVAFTLADEVVAVYKSSGNDLALQNGNGEWVLPVPATYVLGRDGVVIYAHVDADYRERAEPSAVLAALRDASGLPDTHTPGANAEAPDRMPSPS